MCILREVPALLIILPLPVPTIDRITVMMIFVHPCLTEIYQSCYLPHLLEGVVLIMPLHLPKMHPGHFMWQDGQRPQTTLQLPAPLIHHLMAIAVMFLFPA